MGLQPKISNPLVFRDRICPRCGKPSNSDNYLRSKSIGSPDGFSQICNTCIEGDLARHDYNWKLIDRYCQYLDIPFIPNEFEEIHEVDKTTPFVRYAEIFFVKEHETLDWNMYYDQFKKLEERDLIDQELPRLKEEKLMKLRSKWGEKYDEEQLFYLENLYDGILLSQHVNGGLQVDQAKKLCKTSLEIDERIRRGAEYDKLLASYDKLVKIADFTPRNVKNAADFDSVGELFHWLEKRGWKNDFYDDVTRDIVDETLKNIQSYNQRLYVNETGIGEEITRRIESLQSAAESENFYDTQQDYDLDNYANEAFEELLKDETFKEDIE